MINKINIKKNIIIYFYFILFYFIFFFFKKKARNRSKELFNIYYPYEISNEISYKEKYKYMVEWWTKEHDNIIEQKLTQESLDEMIRTRPISFRDGFIEFFKICKSNGIPILIPSAGVQSNNIYIYI